MKTIYLILFALSLTMGHVQTAFANNNHVADKGDELTEVSKSATVSHTWNFMSANNLQFTPEELADNTHTLGSENGCLLQLLKSKCIRKEEIVPGDPQTRTVIQKPAIYSAVQNIEKYLKKELKAERIQKQEAETEFHKVLVKAIAAMDAHDTDSFEDALSDNRKDANKLMSIFAQVSLTNLY